MTRQEELKYVNWSRRLMWLGIILANVSWIVAMYLGEFVWKAFVKETIPVDILAFAFLIMLIAYVVLGKGYLKSMKRINEERVNNNLPKGYAKRLKKLDNKHEKET